MEITSFLHTAILVSDCERADYFYGRVLGLSKVPRKLKYPGSWYQVGDYQIHLIVSPSKRERIDDERQWGRNPHLALSVKNLQRAREELENSGFPTQMSSSGRKALFTQDPDGNIIEITELESFK